MGTDDGGWGMAHITQTPPRFIITHCRSTVVDDLFWVT